MAGRNIPTRYTRGSVERALEHHFRGQWQRRGEGYVLSTDVGLLTMTSLRDAAMVVVAAAEKERALNRARA